MPIKQVQCCVCKQTVNKAQTLAIGPEGMRACRTHDGINETAQKVQEKRKDAEIKVTEKLEQSRRRKSEPEPIDFTPKCFCCKAPGLRRDVYLLEILKCGEKFEMTYGKPLNPFLPEETKIAYSSLSNVRCLWPLEYKESMRLHYHARQAAQMMGVVMLCTECCESQKIEYQPKAQITFEQLTNFMPVYETFIRPNIQEMAAKELTEGN